MHVALLPFPLLWAAFCLRLWSLGHGPSHTLLPIPSEQHYAVQAALLLPLMLFALRLWAALIHASATRLGGTGERAKLQRRLALAYGVCGSLLFVIPEWVCFELGGMEGLRLATRVTAPLCFLCLLAWVERVIQELYQLTLRQSMAVALSTFLLHALPVSLVLR